MAALEQAIKQLGQHGIASACGVAAPNVSRWARTGTVPAHHVIPICRATGWAVRPHDLRPDIYPNVNDAMPRPRRTSVSAG